MKKKPHLSARNYSVLKNAAALMANRMGRFGRLGDFTTYTGHDPRADTKHDKAWLDYGYPDTLTFYMMWHMWRRHPIAKQVCQLPIDYCWIDHPKILEGDDDSHNETAYEKAFSKMCKRLNLWARVKAGDLYQRPGRYSGLIMVVADGKDPSMPIEKVSVDKVINIKPAFEGQLEVTTVDENRQSPRFQQPETYQFREIDTGARSRWDKENTTIHWTRVITMAEGADDGGIYGISCLEPIFNALLDWTKIQGAGGEGFWRAAAQKFVLKAASDTGAQNPTDDELDTLADMLTDMFSGLDSMPFLGNMDIQPLDTNMPNPQYFTAHTEKSISAGSGYPSKIIFGSQTGVKAGDEDTGQMHKLMQSRRENYLTEEVMSVVDWFDKFTDLKKPEEVTVKWSDLTAPSMDKKIELVKGMVDANQKSIASGATAAPFGLNELREALGYEPDDNLNEDFDLIETEELDEQTRA